MADNNTNSFDFLCQAGECKVLQAYQETMEHLSGKSVCILYPTAMRTTDSALKPFSVPRREKTLSKSCRRRRIQRGIIRVLPGTVDSQRIRYKMDNGLLRTEFRVSVLHSADSSSSAHWRPTRCAVKLMLRYLLSLWSDSDSNRSDTVRESLLQPVTNRVKKVASDSFRTIAKRTYKGYGEAPVPKLSNNV